MLYSTWVTWCITCVAQTVIVMQRQPLEVPGNRVAILNSEESWKETKSEKTNNRTARYIIWGEIKRLLRGKASKDVKMYATNSCRWHVLERTQWWGKEQSEEADFFSIPTNASPRRLQYRRASKQGKMRKWETRWFSRILNRRVVQRINFFPRPLKQSIKKTRGPFQDCHILFQAVTEASSAR